MLFVGGSISGTEKVFAVAIFLARNEMEDGHDKDTWQTTVEIGAYNSPHARQFRPSNISTTEKRIES